MVDLELTSDEEGMLDDSDYEEGGRLSAWVNREKIVIRWQTKKMTWILFKSCHSNLR